MQENRLNKFPTIVCEVSSLLGNLVYSNNIKIKRLHQYVLKVAETNCLDFFQGGLGLRLSAAQNKIKLD